MLVTVRFVFRGLRVIGGEPDRDAGGEKMPSPDNAKLDSEDVAKKVSWAPSGRNATLGGFWKSWSTVGPGEAFSSAVE